MNNNRFHLGQRPAGFRLFYRDIVIGVVGLFMTTILWNQAGGDAVYQTLSLLPIIVLGHFFLFCNVFRIGRFSELVWGGIFILILAGMPGCMTGGHRFVGPWKFWFENLLMLSPFTLAVIVCNVLSSDYHGIGYRLIPWGRRPED